MYTAMKIVHLIGTIFAKFTHSQRRGRGLQIATHRNTQNERNGPFAGEEGRQNSHAKIAIHYGRSHSRNRTLNTNNSCVMLRVDITLTSTFETV